MKSMLNQELFYFLHKLYLNTFKVHNKIKQLAERKMVL